MGAPRIGCLGMGLAAVLCFVHSRMPKDVGLSSSHTLPRRVIVRRRFLKPVRNVDGMIRQIPCRVEGFAEKLSGIAASATRRSYPLT